MTRLTFQEQQSPELAKLGDYVVRDLYDQSGRVYTIHDTCPQDEFWLSQQSDQSVRDHVDEPWVSVICRGGGSIVVPIRKVRVVEPFPLDNDWDKVLFRDAAGPAEPEWEHMDGVPCELGPSFPDSDRSPAYCNHDERLRHRSMTRENG